MMRFLIQSFLCLSYFLFCAKPSGGQSLVFLKENRLEYIPYANEGQTNSVNIIPDFSFAGFKKGGVKLPEVPVVMTLHPKSGDCTEMIQQAIDELSKKPLEQNDLRGALLLTKGVYRVDGTLTLSASGIIVRGEGNGTDGTVLIAGKKEKHDFISIQGAGKTYEEVKGSRRKISDRYVATGANSFEVSAGHTFKIGDAVVIQKMPNTKWIENLGMTQYGWKAEDYLMMYERTVTGVDGNKIMINIPMVDPVDERLGEAVIFKSDIKGRISKCGIENIRIESVFDNDEDEEHGWNAIVLKRAENCWVKNVVAKYFGYACVSISDMSVFNTIQDCAMIDPKSITTGARKYSFNIEHGSTGNLIQRCTTWGGRHDYVTGARVPGPNVFLDCVAENTFADIGPHHRWATGILFDNIYGGEMRVQNRKAMGSGHGWAGAQTMFWNCRSVEKEIKVESPAGTLNWGIGCIGLQQNGEGYWESWGTPVEPRSLYLKQLEDRLGKDAVFNVTTDEQRGGILWNKLRAWGKQILAEGKVLY